MRLASARSARTSYKSLSSNIFYLYTIFLTNARACAPGGRPTPEPAQVWCYSPNDLRPIELVKIGLWHNTIPVEGCLQFFAEPRRAFA